MWAICSRSCLISRQPSRNLTPTFRTRSPVTTEQLEFQEKRRLWRRFCAALLLIGYVLVALVPSLQAPDEFDHLRRAYFLGQGQILLESVDGSPSGGQLDPALTDFMIPFTALPHHPENRINDHALQEAASVKWSTTSKFEPAFATAYYLPLLYAPQAIALTIGKRIGLSVNQSYRLARCLALITSVLLLVLAFRIYSPPPVALAILTLPMYLYLVSSAALDGVATAVAVLSLSLFARILEDRNREPLWAFPALVTAVLLLACCRANLLPMLLLPLAAALTANCNRARKVVAVTAATLAAVAWTVYTIKSTVYPPGPRNVNHSARLLELILHPHHFLESLWLTLADLGRTGFYFQSFIGVLGWLDTYLPSFAYRAISILLVCLAACSFTATNGGAELRARLLLVLCAAAAIMLTFLALLVQWVPPGTQVITGIQGRYFIVPALILAYSLTIGGSRISERRRRFITPLLVASIALSATVTVYAVTMRFYVPADPAMQYRQPPA